MKRDEVLTLLKGRRDELSNRYHVTSVALLGRRARDQAGPESDVDILVDFPGPPTFDQYMGLKIETEDLLGEARRSGYTARPAGKDSPIH